MREVYHAEIVGALIRPDYLKKARQRVDAHDGGDEAGGALSRKEYKKIEDWAVNEAISMQESLGLDVVNDGEQRRLSFLERWTVGIEGVAPIPGPAYRMRGTLGEVEWRWPMTVVDKLIRRTPQAIEEFTYARARTSKPIKVTLPSPMLLATLYAPGLSSDAYPDPFELFADGAAILRQECLELATAGCDYIQIDCPELLMVGDQHARDTLFVPRNIAPERFLNEGIALLNTIADVPGVTFGMHICRGGGGAKMHFAEGGYNSISKRLFREATNFRVFLLEYDDARSGSFEPLRDVPTDRTVVLGLISNIEAPSTETREQLVERIETASNYFPRENLAISSRCGFSGCPSTEMQFAKLRLVADVAHSVWL